MDVAGWYFVMILATAHGARCTNAPPGPYPTKQVCESREQTYLAWPVEISDEYGSWQRARYSEPIQWCEKVDANGYPKFWADAQKAIAEHCESWKKEAE